MAVIRELRDSLGFSVDEVASAAGWSRRRQRQIELSDDLESFESDRLADLLGADIEGALEAGAAPEHPVAALLRGQSATLDAASRFSIAEATSVARSVRALQHELGEPSVWEKVSSFHANSDYSHPSEGTPEVLANQTRRFLNLGAGSIRSVQEDVLQALRVLVMWDELPEDIDAYSFATEECGAVFVGNLRGPHMGSAFGRRVTWAHELCHVLYDRPQMRRMSRFCDIRRPSRRPRRYEEDFEYTTERRARAFAAYFLAPREDVSLQWAATRHLERRERVRSMMDLYGLGYEAIRSHLDSLKLLGKRVQMEQVPTQPLHAAEVADPWPAAVVTRRSVGVSSLRSGVVFETVTRAFREGLLSEEGARDFLRVGVNDWPRVRPMLASTGMARTWRTSASHVSDWL